MNKITALIAAVAATFAPKSTDKVLSSFSKTIDQLDQVVAYQDEQSDKTYRDGLALIERSVEHDDEREKAANAAAKLRRFFA